MSKFLMQKGANINAIGGRWGTCLQRAGGDSDDELLRLVLDAGAVVNLEGGLYGSPLQATSSHGISATCASSSNSKLT